MRVKRNTSSNWAADYTVYPAGMVLRDTDSGLERYADGLRPYFQLPLDRVGVDIFDPNPVAIAYAATITPNADTTTIANVGTLTGDIIIANPTGTPLDGQTLRLRFTQDATGGRATTYGSAYEFSTNIPSTDPTTANTTWSRTFMWNATTSKWRATSAEGVAVVGGGGGSGDVTGPSSAVDSEVALFSGTTGKTLKRATGSGLTVLTSGVQSTVTAPTGAVVGTTDTQTLTNKTLTSGTNTFPTFNQNTTGSAATLTTPRTINGVAFDGSANITVPGSLGVWDWSDYGFAGWNYDPVAATLTGGPSSGIQYMWRLKAGASANITKLYTSIAASTSVTATATQNYMGLYDTSMNLLASTASGGIDAALTAPGLLAGTISSTAVTAGTHYYIAFLWNGTGTLSLSRTAIAGGMANMNLGASVARFATGGTSRIVLAATPTLSLNTSMTAWCGFGA